MLEPTRNHRDIGRVPFRQDEPDIVRTSVAQA
jgi:hypothetical protein